MSKNIMDTQELSEIKKLIGSDPSTFRQADAFDVDEILKEVGSAPSAPKPEPPAEAPKKSRFRIIEHAVTDSPAPRQEAPAAPPADKPTPPGKPAAKGNIVQLEHLPRHKLADAPVPEAVPTLAPSKPAPKAAPTPARRPLLDDDELPDYDPRAAKKEEKARRRAQKKAARDARRSELLEEEQNAYQACDPRVAARATARRIRSLGGRSVFVFLLGAAATYLSVAGGLGLPLPGMLDFSAQPLLTTMVLMVLQFLAMLVAIDVIGMGVYALFTGAPDRKTLVAATCIATLAHALSMIIMPAWDQVLPFCCISILVLLACMLEEKGRLAARHFTVKAAMLSPQPAGMFCHHDQRDGVRRVTKVHAQDCIPFLTELEKPDLPQDISFVYSPVILAASVIFALVGSIGQSAPSRFFWSAAAILSLCTPLGVILGVGKAHSRIAKRLLKEGAALSSIFGAAALRRGRQAVFDDVDLFPPGSVTVTGLRNYGKYDNEKLLAYAAAVTSGAGLGIGRVFADKLREQYGRPVRANDILRYDSGGLSADIGPDSVLVGTASFLTRLGVRIHDIAGVENGVFVVINNQVAGAFLLDYQPTAQSYAAIHSLRRSTRPLVLARDFNISSAMVESLFEMRSGTVEEVTGERVDLLCDPAYVKSDTICAILSRDSITPYAEVLRCADKLLRTVRARMVIGIVAGLCGLLLGFYLVHDYSLSALTPKNLLLYQLLWYLPVFFVGLGTRK